MWCEQDYQWVSVWRLAWLFHVLNSKGIAFVAETYVATTNAWRVPTAIAESGSLMKLIRSRYVIPPCCSSRFKALIVAIYSGKLYLCSWHGGRRWYHHRHRYGLSPQEPENRRERVLLAKIWTKFLKFMTFFVSTNSMVNKIITYSITTGILTRFVFNPPL